MSSSSGTAAHLNIGGVFERTGEIYKRAFGTFWLVALILLIPAAILEAAFGTEGAGGLVSLIVRIVAYAWLAGAIIRLVQDVQEDGQVDYTVGGLLGSVWPKLLAIIGLEILLYIIISIGFILLVIPGVILALVLAVALPALVVEDIGVFDSMSRSAALTKNNRMRILAIGLLTIVIVIGVVLITVALVAVEPILGAIVGLVLGILLYPYISMLAAVLYYNLVEVKEGGVVAVEETVVIEEDAGPPPVN